MKYDVVILTEAQYIAPPKEQNEYLKNVLLEDNLVIDALVNKGLRAIKKDWADPDFDWGTTHTILFRSTWDYFHRFAEFSDWLEKVKEKTILINPADQIIWNMDKHYLSTPVRSILICQSIHYD